MTPSEAVQAIRANVKVNLGLASRESVAHVQSAAQATSATTATPVASVKSLVGAETVAKKTRKRTSPGFKLGILAILVLASVVMYLFIDVNPRYFEYVMSLRVPKLLAMLTTAFCIGTATIVFQSIINNTIVTPCLLGMNSLYVVIHTALVFVLGSSSIIVTTKTLSFPIDLVLMGIAAILIYGTLFKKAKGNVLYVLLAGTVMATFFTSIATTLQRAMDPNEYETLQNSIIAGFNRVNSDILLIAAIAIVLIIIWLWRDLKVLDVITLGKDQATNLGVDYDRTIRRLLIGVALFIATATALVGPISFLGLIIANIARELMKTYKHMQLMLSSAMIGIVILLVGQAVIEHVLHFSTTIAVFINVGGGLYFLYLLMRNRSRT